LAADRAQGWRCTVLDAARFERELTTAPTGECSWTQTLTLRREHL